MKIESHVELAQRTTLGVGGAAAYYARAETEADLREALAFAKARTLPVRVLGGGSNLVVGDAGVAGLVIDIALRGVSISGNEVRARAGEPWDDFVADMVSSSYQGLECLSGIPGRVGATPIQNVGAYGQDVSETIACVEAYDTQTGAVRVFSNADCGFAYRDSFFKSVEPGRYIVTEVCFRLRPSAAPALRYAELERHFVSLGVTAPTLGQVREAVIGLRHRKSMVLDPTDPNSRSCGSFFTNPVLAPAAFGDFSARAQGEGNVPTFPQADGRVKLSAGWLIEHAGFARGFRAGNVGLSSKHALAIVAHDGARAEDVLGLARRIQAGVHARFGVHLEPEPVYWGEPQPTLA